MGIYSTEAAKLFKANEVEFDPNAAGLLEFAINSQEADHAMFEAMLEMDYMEYYQEAGQMVVTEEEKSEGAGNAIKAVGKKIVAAIEKFLQVVQVAMQKLVNFVMEKTKADKKLVEKFGKSLDLAKAKQNNPDGKVVVGKVDEAAAAIAKFVSEKKKGYEEATSLSAADFSAKKDEVKKDADELASKFNDFFEEKKISELSDTSFVDLVDGGYKALAEKVISKEAKDLQETLKKARSAALKNFVDAKVGGSKEDKVGREVVAAEFGYISALNSSLSKVINFGATVVTHTMAEARKTFVKVAMAANKKEKAEKEVKESFDYDEILEFALEVATDNMYLDASIG